MEALPELIASRLGDVRALCEKYRVKRLTLFGSAVKGTFDPVSSDVDFVVEFLPEHDPIRAGRTYLNLWRDLESLFNRRVDLVEISTIRNPYFAESVRRDQRVFYEAA